jgi:acyl-CoA synthetase (AMP-forming)/AMP-acid ligase II
MATLRAGAVAVPVNPRVAARELEHIAADSGAVAVVAGPDQLERATGLGGGLTVIGPGAPVDWAALTAGDDTEFRPPVRDDDLSDILYTSGTTGVPKGVEITHRSVADNLFSAPLDRTSTLMHSAPIATFLATHGIQALVVQFALTELVLPTFDAARFAALVGAERPEWLTMVPAHALLLLESGELDAIDTSATSVVMFGGAPMPHDAIKGLAAAFPKASLINGYGLTESGTTVVAMPAGEALKRPGAVGKPFDPAAVRIVDEAGGDVPEGSVGEVAIKVPPGQRRYHNDDEATAAAWRGEWLHTGDLGFLDGEGYLHLVDRKKDVIVRGGYNVSSLEVEGALHEHPDVVEAAVVGIEHRVLGQDVAAVLRLRNGADPDDLDLDTFLADRLTDYKRPRKIVVSTAPLPRTAMGKLDKKALREQLASG